VAGAEDLKLGTEREGVDEGLWLTDPELLRVGGAGRVTLREGVERGAGMLRLRTCGVERGAMFLMLGTE
jgi:hypothetical protein